MNNLPLYKKDHAAFLREEKDDYLLVVSSQIPELGELILNPTVKKILNWCDGKTSAEEIEKKLQKKYGNVDEKIIKSDVANTLKRLTNIGLLRWTIENPYKRLKLKEKYMSITCYRANENDILKINDYLQNGIEKNCNYLSPYMSLDDYNKVILRNKLFTFSEDFYIAEKNGNISAIIAISLPSRVKSISYSVNMIIGDIDTVDLLLCFAVEKTTIEALREIKKIKVEIEDKSDLSELIKKLSQNQFVIEGVLKSETINNLDIKVLSRFVNV